MNVSDWQGVYVDVAIVIRACRQVVAADDAPGYVVHGLLSCRWGQIFIVGNGVRVPKDGQVAVNF